ncbi:MAG: hypothetical protein HY821_17005 [Acidobacteria bacterium]|nr:hypothetical protein [Acidobacteriota bacterium]
MFEFLFKYPWPVYRKGTLVLANPWPLWMLGIGLAAAVGYALWLFLRKPLPRRRALALAGLEWAVLAVLLLFLWQPALSVATLKPQQNVVSVLVDTSASMGLDGRIGAAQRLLNSSLLPELRKRFPVRVYEAGRGLQLAGAAPAAATQPVSRLGEALEAAAAEASTLPIGAIVLLSDGADNAGGISAETMDTLRRSRIPIHAVGFGPERMRDDVEITDAQVPARALPDSRVSATVTLRQAGYGGRMARLTVKEGSKVLAARDVKLPGDGEGAREEISFPAGAAGAKALEISIALQSGEINGKNNALTRLLDVRDKRPRILYFEGEPRWEMKFIRRAAELDKNLHLVSILRTTQNKFYRQGIENPKELERGFPDTIDELFAYQALIIGNVEAGYFNAAQQSLIQEFVDRRGGGVLFLGGRAALSEGGWNHSPVAQMLPMTLPDRRGTFHREPATAELTSAGRDSLITRMEEDAGKNLSKWKALPYLADYQETGAAKPGALVLAELTAGGRGRFPLLATQPYGRGRVALFATGGSWRWQMAQDSKDMSHEMFWRQLLRWVAGDVNDRVTLSTARQVYSDETRVALRAEVRDRNYLPAADAVVEASVIGPNGSSAVVPLLPVKNEPGAYAAEWKAEAAGSYVAEVSARQGETDLGRDTLTFRREDGVAENFRTEQNRELLERLAQQTGGRYYEQGATSALAAEIELSDAGISVKEVREIWSAPVAFLLLAGLKGAAWLLRRRWGAV